MEGEIDSSPTLIYREEKHLKFTIEVLVVPREV